MLPICYLHLDTEFANFRTFSPLSIGIVSEDKKFEFYKEVNDFDRTECSDFVHSVVIPLLDLPKSGMPYLSVSQELIQWINLLPYKEVMFIADYSGDILILERLLSVQGKVSLNKKVMFKMMDKAFNQVVMERNLYDHRNIHKAFDALANGVSESLMKEPHKQHHALYDAHANCDGWNKAFKVLKNL